MKIKFFNNIYINTFEFIQEGIVNKFKNKNEIQIYEQFTNYLKVEDVLFCYKMIEQGYNINKFQQTKLETVLLNKIINGEYNYKDIKSINLVNNEIKMMALIHTMPQRHITHDHLKNKEYNSELDKYIQEIFENNDNKKLFIKLFKQKVTSLKSCFSCKTSEDGNSGFYLNNKIKPRSRVKEIHKILYLAGLAINNNSFIESEVDLLLDIVEKTNLYLVNKIYKEFSREAFKILGKEALDCFIININLIQKETLFNNNKEVVLNKIHNLNIHKQKLTNELIVKEEYSLDSLPLKAKEKVESIQKIVQGLNSKEINDFIQERFTVILKKYFSIDEEYRTELKNIEGFNAQELMMQSLDNIEKIVKAKQQDNNYDLLSELSVENRKLKAKV